MCNCMSFLAVSGNYNESFDTSGNNIFTGVIVPGGGDGIGLGSEFKDCGVISVVFLSAPSWAETCPPVVEATEMSNPDHVMILGVLS